ncbi:MAG: hypothetical protein ACLR1V_01300 [Coprococcus sp.]
MNLDTDITQSKEIHLFENIRDLKEKGFQLKAIRLIITTLNEDAPFGKKENAEVNMTEDELAAASPTASREQEDTEHHKPENQISDNETTGGNEEQETKEKEDKPVPVEAKPYKVLSAEDKMKHFKTIMDGIVTEALQRNNVQLENTMISQVTDVVIQELGKVEERQEGQSERYYKLLDEAIRGKQRAGREVAAAKVPSYGVPKRRKRLFKRKFRY